MSVWCAAELLCLARFADSEKGDEMSRALLSHVVCRHGLSLYLRDDEAAEEGALRRHDASVAASVPIAEFAVIGIYTREEVTSDCFDERWSPSFAVFFEKITAASR